MRYKISGWFSIILAIVVAVVTIVTGKWIVKGIITILILLFLGLGSLFVDNDQEDINEERDNRISAKILSVILVTNMILSIILGGY